MNTSLSVNYEYMGFRMFYFNEFAFMNSTISLAIYAL